MRYTSDILIIGAGISGCATARELSRYQASITVIDQACDVAEGATKANSGIVHAGYDAAPGSRKAYYNVRGAALFPALCEELFVPYVPCGALVIGFNDTDRQTLMELLHRGVSNGVQGLRILDREELLALEPALNPEVSCALHVPTSAVVSPYELAFALADDAAVNGVTFRFRQRVLSVSRKPEGGYLVRTVSDEFDCHVLVNCAGASSAMIHNQLAGEKLRMVHRRGQYYLLDHAVKSPFSHTIFQCPTIMGKGVLVTPTAHGNVLLGPSAEDIDDPRDTATTREGLDFVLSKVRLTWPAASTRLNITNFSGVRAHLMSDDFLVGPIPDCPGAFEAAGIESPGLSSAPAIGADLARQAAAYLNAPQKKNLVPYPRPVQPLRDMPREEQAAAIAADPAQGNLICRCEVVTEAEIRAAIRRPVGATTVDGVKRRTRAGMGRCQGGFCMPRVTAILAEELGRSPLEIKKGDGDSYLLTGTLSDTIAEGGKDHE